MHPIISILTVVYPVMMMMMMMMAIDQDVLELTCDDRGLALSCVVGILEDGKISTVKIRQKRAPTEGQVNEPLSASNCLTELIL